MKYFAPDHTDHTARKVAEPGLKGRFFLNPKAMHLAHAAFRYSTNMEEGET